MRALQWDGHTLRLEPDHAPPELRPGWVRLRTRLAGICSTDLQIFQGYMGFTGVPGHEAVLEVLEVAGDPDHPQVGERVVAEINFACGACTACARGLERHCPHRTVLGILGADGVFADEVTAPLVNLHRVPAAVPDEAAVFAEPLAAAFEILEQVPHVGGVEALVLGDGKLGLLCAQVLAASGARVTVIGKHEGKLRLAGELGLTPLAVDAFHPDGAHDLVVEATGSARGLETAMAAVRPRGTLVLKTTVAAQHSVSLAPLVINEVTVVGSRCGPFAPALTALAEGRVHVAPLISAEYPLDEGLAAVERAKVPGTLKVLLRP